MKTSSNTSTKHQGEMGQLKGLKGDYFSETSTGAMKFFSQFCNSSSVQERISLVRTLSSVTKRASFGRAGFMTLAACISSIACTAYQHNEGVSQSYLWSCSVDPDQANSIPQSSAGLLENMQFFLEQSKQHFNQNYRRQVFDYILAAVSTLVSVHDVPLDTLLHFISVFPRAFTDAGCNVPDMLFTLSFFHFDSLRSQAF
ncbi:hypothetical protein AMTR_s00002p00162270 [Amborella trichopoda]|uniref:Uncharacterized protein n=1 Tax=Amborella trichopoda TaxID=13333 RepID=W1NZF7_AMBTC|nr:hypothetical protein AMTR_s00002p00162270 [Amborella trichopoda]